MLEFRHISERIVLVHTYKYRHTPKLNGDRKSGRNWPEILAKRTFRRTNCPDGRGSTPLGQLPWGVNFQKGFLATQSRCFNGRSSATTVQRSTKKESPDMPIERGVSITIRIWDDEYEVLLRDSTFVRILRGVGCHVRYRVRGLRQKSAAWEIVGAYAKSNSIACIGGVAPNTRRWE